MKAEKKDVQVKSLKKVTVVAPSDASASRAGGAGKADPNSGPTPAPPTRPETLKVEPVATKTINKSIGGVKRTSRMPPKKVPGTAAGSTDPAPRQPAILDLRRGPARKRKRDEFEISNIFGERTRDGPPKRRA